MPADTGHRSNVDPDLHERLHRWVAASLITPEEADAIQAFEKRRPESDRRRVPLVTEALAYLGAALAAAAAGVLLGDRWDAFTPAIRAACVGSAAAGALVGGYLLRSSDEPAFARLASVLWLIGTGLFAWFAWLISYDVLDQRGRVPTLVMGIATTVLGGILYAARRQGGQQIALFAGILMVAGASMPQETPAALALWGVAAAWTALGIAGILRPRRVALLAGSIVALWVPTAMGVDGDLGMWLGLMTGIVLVLASVVVHEPVLLGLGAVGVFGYTLRVLVRLFGGTAAMPIALLVAGATVLVIALAFARRASRSATRAVPRSPS